MTLTEVVPYIGLVLGVFLVFVDKQMMRNAHSKEIALLKKQMETIEERLAVCARALLAEPRAVGNKNLKTHTLLTREAR